MLLLKLDILRHRIMGAHHVQYSVLKTPEQTKQRPASLIYSKQHDLTKNGFLTQIKCLIWRILALIKLAPMTVMSVK